MAHANNVDVMEQWSPFDTPGTAPAPAPKPSPKPSTAPSSAHATPAPESPDADPRNDPGDLEHFSMLSLPQLPTFGNARRGPSLTDVQAWHKNVVVPRFLEILEQVKALQRQTLEARREAEAAHAAADDTHRDNVQLRKQVADWEARAATLRAEPEQLQKVLVHAQTLADQLIADGEAQAGQVRDAAAAQAEQVRAAAQADAQRIRAEAETAAQALVGEARQLYEQHDAIVRTIQAVSAQAATAFRDLAGQVEQTAEALAKSRPHADAIQAIKHG